MEEKREREGVDKGRRKKGKKGNKREREEGEEGEEENDTRRERVGRKWIYRKEERGGKRGWKKETSY